MPHRVSLVMDCFEQDSHRLFLSRRSRVGIFLEGVDQDSGLRHRPWASRPLAGGMLGTPDSRTGV